MNKIEIFEKITHIVIEKFDYIFCSRKELMEAANVDYNSIISFVEKTWDDTFGTKELEINEKQIFELAEGIVSALSLSHLTSTISIEEDKELKTTTYVENIIFNPNLYKKLYKKNKTYTEIINNLKPENSIHLTRLLKSTGGIGSFYNSMYTTMLFIFIPFLWPIGIYLIVRHFINEDKIKKHIENDLFEVRLRLIKYSELLTNSLFYNEYMVN